MIGGGISPGESCDGTPSRTVVVIIALRKVQGASGDGNNGSSGRLHS